MKLKEEQKNNLMNFLKSAGVDLQENLNLFSGKNLEIKINNIHFKKFNELSELFCEKGEPMMTAVAVLMLIGINGYFIIALKSEAAENFARNILGKDSNNFNNWDEMEVSTICETSNILGTTFANSIGKALGRIITTTRPHFNLYYFSPIIQELVASYAEMSDDILMLEMNFLENDKDFEMNFFFIPAPDSLEELTGIDT